MESNRTTPLGTFGQALLQAALLFAWTVGAWADTNELRYVEVHSLLGQVYDTAISVEDTETFGLSIPRGTALPRRMYPVRNLGVPMIHRLDQPHYREVLLRRPLRCYTEHLDPNPETGETTVTEPSAPSVSVSTDTGGDETIVLSWPTTSAGWELESAPALVGDGSVWTPVPASSYQTNGRVIICTQPLQSVSNWFFRLRKL
jgi:hypothetical protein